jgi:hypothetical protein
MAVRRIKCLVDEWQPGASGSETSEGFSIFVVIGLVREPEGRSTTEITFVFDRGTAEAFYEDDCKHNASSALLQVAPVPHGQLWVLRSTGPIPTEWEQVTLSTLDTLLKT